MADWLLRNHLEAELVVLGVVNEDSDGVAKLLGHPCALDAGAHVGMFSGAGDSTLLLTRIVRARGDMRLEEAVRQLTSLPAEVFHIPRRGSIAAGQVGDLALFRLEDLHWDAETFVQDLPGDARRLRRGPGGFRYTIVHGPVTQIDGVLTGDFPGSVLEAAGR